MVSPAMKTIKPRALRARSRPALQRFIRTTSLLWVINSVKLAIVSWTGSQIWAQHLATDSVSRSTRYGQCGTATFCASNLGWMQLRIYWSRRRLRSLISCEPNRESGFDVEVTYSDDSPHPFVSQEFCSALPVACSPIPSVHRRAFASLVLESAYEATMWAALENAQRGRSNVVLLTSLAGGAFRNYPEWIHAAIRRALPLAAPFDLDVRLLSNGPPSSALIKMVEDLQ